MQSTQSASSRLFNPDRLQTAMDDAGLDAVVGHSRRNFYYLSSFPTLEYVIDPDATNYVVVPRDCAQPASVAIPVSESATLADVEIWPAQRILCGRFHIQGGPPPGELVAASTWEGLLLALRQGGLEAGRVGFELDQLPESHHKRLVEALPAMEIVDCSSLLKGVRMVKSAEEIRRLRIVCTRTEEAIDNAIPQVRAGMTEREAARLIAVELVARGLEVVYVQVSAPEAAGLGGPTDRKLQAGDVIRTDVAASYFGYHSDLGRGFALGSISSEQREYYQVAHQALQEGIAAVRDGAPARSVFAASMSVWEHSRHPHVQRHHVGHGLGLQAHEAPMLRPDADTPIEPGMVLAVEVPCYVYGLGGFAPEDVLVVGEGGNEVFTHAPAELPVI